MAVSVEAIIAIEESLTQRLSLTYNKLAANYLRQLLPAVEAQDWNTAEQIANSIDVTPVFEQNKAYIEYCTYAAMIFGATRLTKKADQTIITTRDHSSEMNKGTALLQVTLQSVAKRMKESILEELDRVRLDLRVNTVKAARLAQPFQSFAEKGASTLQLVSQLHTSRLSAFGFTAEAEVLGVTKYSISEQLDTSICPICAHMHGKSFRVVDARGTLERILDTTDADELKTLQPWPKQNKEGVAAFKKLTADELVVNNWHIPPFHGSCRGLLVASKDVPPLNLLPKNDLPLGDPAWAPWASLLRDVDKNTIVAYASSDYTSINKYLRFGGKGLTVATSASVEAKVRVLQEVFKKAPTVPAGDAITLVYRGIRSTPAIQKKYSEVTIGSVIRDKGFVSTSKNMGQASSFSIGESGILVEIELPAGTKVLDMAAMNLEGVLGSEQEVLLKANSAFYVTGVERHPDGTLEKLSLRAAL